MAYKMTHPENPKHEIQVDAGSVETYESQGWETKPTAKTPEKSDDK